MVRSIRLTVTVSVILWSMLAAAGEGAAVSAANRDDLGRTALHRAVSGPNESAQTVRRLLQSGADVNAKTNDGSTALHLAVMRNYQASVKLLLASGADVNAQDNGGRTPLYQAVFSDHKDIAEILLRHAAQAEPAELAALGKAEQLEKMLTANNALVGQRDSVMGYTPLLWAAMRRQKQTTEMLLRFRPHLDVFTAAAVGDVNELRRLLAEHRNVNSTDRSGATPLFFAILAGQREAAEFLLTQGADPNAGHPLHAAARLGDREMVKLLLDHGADKGAFIPGRGTPLTVAMGAGHPELADLLK